ncbi:hypothetical protein ONZ45_g3547 [Pleurotus djamor]|nr:hypothetical protein ONZ45_g3547 [Pleurotus djamor]
MSSTNDSITARRRLNNYTQANPHLVATFSQTQSGPQHKQRWAVTLYINGVAKAQSGEHANLGDAKEDACARYLQSIGVY